MTYPHKPGHAPDSATSREAADRLSHSDLFNSVLDFIYVSNADGCTVDEALKFMETKMQRTFDRTTIGARFTEARLNGFIEDTGKTRLTPRLRRASVYRITVKGRDRVLNG